MKKLFGINCETSIAPLQAEAFVKTADTVKKYLGEVELAIRKLPEQEACAKMSEACAKMSEQGTLRKSLCLLWTAWAEQEINRNKDASLRGPDYRPWVASKVESCLQPLMSQKLFCARGEMACSTVITQFFKDAMGMLFNLERQGSLMMKLKLRFVTIGNALAALLPAKKQTLTPTGAKCLSLTKELEGFTWGLNLQAAREHAMDVKERCGAWSSATNKAVLALQKKALRTSTGSSDEIYKLFIVIEQAVRDHVEEHRTQYPGEMEKQLNTLVTELRTLVEKHASWRKWYGNLSHTIKGGSILTVTNASGIEELKLKERAVEEMGGESGMTEKTLTEWNVDIAEHKKKFQEKAVPVQKKAKCLLWERSILLLLEEDMQLDPKKFKLNCDVINTMYKGYVTKEGVPLQVFKGPRYLILLVLFFFLKKLNQRRNPHTHRAVHRMIHLALLSGWRAGHSTSSVVQLTHPTHSPESIVSRELHGRSPNDRPGNLFRRFRASPNARCTSCSGTRSARRHQHRSPM